MKNASLKKRLLALLCLLLQSIACTQSAAPILWPLTVGHKHYAKIELALTPDSREVGLMYRLSMPDDAGMLFVFPEEKTMAFWMKNTKIPLDILFLDADGKVVAMHTMKVEPPKTDQETDADYESRLPGYPSWTKAQFALELNAGEIAQNGIMLGQRITLRTDRLLKMTK